MYFSPYCTSALNTLQETSLSANILTLFVGLMLIIDHFLEDAATLAGNNYDLTGRNVISVIILLVNIAVVVLPILVKMSNSDSVTKQISKVFSSKDQSLKPQVLQGYCGTVRAEGRMVHVQVLDNARVWA